MRRILPRLVRCLVCVSAPFALAIGILLLSLLDVVTLDPRIVPRGKLIVNLLLYWALAGVLLATIVNARAVGRFLAPRCVPLAVTMISLGLALYAGELAARIAFRGTEGFGFVPSPTLHHRNPPNVNVHDSTGASVRTNEDGFRTDWGRESFRGQRERVVVMGDSYVFGLGVEGDETVPFYLQQILTERSGHSDIGVLNAGVISHSPIIHRSAFREVVREYSPTLTILLLDLGDIGDDYKYARAIVPGSDPDNPVFDIADSERKSHGNFALVKLADPIFALLRVPFDVARRFRPQRAVASRYSDFEIEIDGVIETNRWFILRHPLEKTRPLFEASLSYIRDIARDARAAGSRFVLVVPPRYFQWSDRECPNDWAADTRKLDEPYEYAAFEFFDEAAKTAEFPIKSLLPEFRATTRFPLVLNRDAHLNPDGNRFVAEVVADYLVTNRWVGIPAG